MAANKATESDFPPHILKDTNEILPPSPQYVEIDDDVSCAPTRKIQALQAQLHKVGDLLKAGEISQARQLTEQAEKTSPVAISKPNEDGISNNIREQLVTFAASNNISVDFNKAIGDMVSHPSCT